MGYRGYRLRGLFFSPQFLLKLGVVPGTGGTGVVPGGKKKTPQSVPPVPHFLTSFNYIIIKQLTLTSLPVDFRSAHFHDIVQLSVQ